MTSEFGRSLTGTETIGMQGLDPSGAAELRKFADLDVLGQLDEIDARAFERAFRDAPVTLQEDIRDRQERLGRALIGAPDAADEAAARDARERILGAVGGQIEQADASLAPIATIGRRSRHAAIARGHDTHAAATDNASARHLRRAVVIWRAAAFALAAGIIAASYFVYSTSAAASRLTEIASQQESANQLRDQIATLGPDVAERFARSRLQGLRTAPGAAGAFIAMIDAQSRETGLLAFNVPRGDYRIEVRDSPAGDWEAVTEFTIHEQRLAFVSLDDVTENMPVVLAGQEWRIVGSDDVVVASWDLLA